MSGAVYVTLFLTVLWTGLTRLLLGGLCINIYCRDRVQSVWNMTCLFEREGGPYLLLRLLPSRLLLLGEKNVRTCWYKHELLEPTRVITDIIKCKWWHLFDQALAVYVIRHASGHTYWCQSPIVVSIGHWWLLSRKYDSGAWHVWESY